MSFESRRRPAATATTTTAAGTTAIAAAAVLVALLGVAPVGAGEPWIAPESARAVASPLVADTATLAAARVTYDRACKNCHGAEGRGDGKGSTYLRTEPKDFHDPDLQAATDGELFWKVTTGRAPMPGFADKLTAEERWLALLQVRAFAATPAAEATLDETVPLETAN